MHSTFIATVPLSTYFHHEMILVTQLVAAIWKIDTMTSPIKSRAYTVFCMSPQQVSRRQSPSRVFCCFITALSFVIVVPTVWITAALWLRSVGDLDYVADSDIENTDRSVRILVCSRILTSYIAPSLYSLLNWYQPISMMVLWSQSGPSRRIRALQIQTAQKLKFSSTCSESFMSASGTIIITYLNLLLKVYLRQIADMGVVPTIIKH